MVVQVTCHKLLTISFPTDGVGVSGELLCFVSLMVTRFLDT